MVFRIVTPWHKHSISSEFKTSPLCYVISNQIHSKLPVYIYECGPSVLFLLSNSCFWVIHYFQWIQPMTSLASLLLPHKWYVFTKGRKQIFILVISKGILFIPARWSWPHELWIQSWPPSLPTVWVFPSWRFFFFNPREAVLYPSLVRLSPLLTALTVLFSFHLESLSHHLLILSLVPHCCPNHLPPCPLSFIIYWEP